jgi:hypothetical protein
MAGSIGDKRPAPTIEGTATEVAIEDPNAETEVDAGDEATASEEPPHTTAAASEPPSKPHPRFARLKGFVSHLAAGALGGLIVWLASLLGLLDFGKQTAPAPEIAALEQRLAKLEGASPGSAETLSTLDARIAALETEAKQAPPELAGLDDRVAKLESALKSLAETASEGGSVADAAAINQAIAEAEKRLDAKLAEAAAANETALKQVQSEVAELKARVGALAEAGLGDGGADVGPEFNTLSERIAKLEETLPELVGALGKESAGTKSAAAAIAFANLRAAVTDGRPYAAELDTIVVLSPVVGDLGVLPAYAEKGIPTVPELARSFDGAREAALAAAEPATGGSFFDSLMASAQSLVKITPLDEAPAGEGASATLGRAKTALGKGDLAAAVKEVETLEGAPRAAFSAWLGDAHARLGAEETLARLEGLLLVIMSGEVPAQQLQQMQKP